MIQDAEAYRQERISEAEGQAARFNDMYREYQKYPLITKKRMLYETLEQVLPDLKVIINSSDGTQTMLPLLMGVIPKMQFRRVVLPPPDGPRMEMISPS